MWYNVIVFVRGGLRSRAKSEAEQYGKENAE